MADVNQAISVRSATSADLERLLQKVESMKERHDREFDGLADELRAYLPKIENQARYRRIRDICRDKSKIKAVLRGEMKI